MGNQATKGTAAAGKFQDDDSQKKSRTNWQAGVASPPGRPVIELSSRIIPQGDEKSSVTDEINLTWEVPADDGGYPITGYRVEMLDIKSGAWIEITFIEGYEPKCTLSNILYGIMYRFRVIALNDAGPSEPGEPSEPVVIDVPGVQIAPYFVHTLNDVVIALEHDKIEFQVRVLGTPKPSIQWFKDEAEIFPCERIKMVEEADGGLVTLTGARLSDSGSIRCVATNHLGKAVSAAQLIIEAPPRFEVPDSYQEGLIFRHDELIRLRLPLVAKPAAKVVWFFEDEPISAGSDLMIETTDIFTSLRIQAARRWHCGEFRVYAENEYGEDAASILVTVTSPPMPPGRPVVIDISETKCTLRWEPSDDDGGADVKHYVVEYFRDVWDVWLKAMTTKECQAVIDDLIAGSRYKFRIKAENVYGISDPGEESDPFDVAGNAVSDSSRAVVPAMVPTKITVTEPNEEDPMEQLKPPLTMKQEIDDGVAKGDKRLQGTRSLWGSDDQEDEDILDRFLRVKEFAESRMPSYESDGIPSISGLDDGPEGMSTIPSGALVNRHLRKSQFIESRQHSGDSNHPDLESVSADDEEDDGSLLSDTNRRLRTLASNLPQSGYTLQQQGARCSDDMKRARELFAELRQLSDEAGGSIEDIMGSLAASNESITTASSTVTMSMQKREELSRFEATLREMIEEAKQMMDNQDNPPNLLPTGFHGLDNDPLRSMEEPWSMKSSSSVQSVPETVITVIENPRDWKAELAHKAIPPKIFLTGADGVVTQPPRGSPLATHKGPATQPASLGTAAYGSQTTPKVTQRKTKEAPPVGSDRYEEMITQASRGRRGSSTSISSLGRGIIGNGFKSNSSLDDQLDGCGEGGTIVEGSSFCNLSWRSSQPSVYNSSSNMADLGAAASTNLSGEFAGSHHSSSNPALRAAGVVRPRSVVPSLPTIASRRDNTTEAPFQPKLIQVSTDPTKVPSRDQLDNETLGVGTLLSYPPESSLYPTSAPHWLIITLTYSAMFMSILLISNFTPDGKLYIHFTAFWSLLLYYFMEEDLESRDFYAADPLEEMMEGFVIKHHRNK